MLVIRTCADCNNPCVFINSARESFFEGIKWVNVTTNRYLNMLGHKKEIIYNEDGTLLARHSARGAAGGSLTNGWHHILKVQNPENSTHDDAPDCFQEDIAGTW